MNHNNLIERTTLGVAAGVAATFLLQFKVCARLSRSCCLRLCNRSARILASL
jgi:hypothetical protein